MAGGGGVPVHFLRGNASEWSPRRACFIDTETYPEEQNGREVLRLRLWCGAAVDRRPRGAVLQSVRSGHGSGRRDLARWVDAQTVGYPTTWLYAHNLGFDLTVSRLPDFLHRLGWIMTSWRFGGKNVTGRMRKGSKTLTLVDSVSLLPYSLDQIGRWLGREKLAMPDFDGPEEDWLDYCSRDVAILSEAVLTLMAWWDANQLGHWSTSGPACGWNSLRHIPTAARICVDPDPPGVAADRSAIRGGRRDVTRVGTIAGGPFALVDFSNAYLNVCAHLPTPIRRVVPVPRVGLGDLDGMSPRYGLICECTVRSASPRYPLRTARGVFYPVGTFTTVLAQPEIAEARRRGELLEVGPGWRHELSFPLRRWASWCLGLLDSANDETAAVVKGMVKQWGRSVPGKFAGRGSRQVDYGPSLYPGWHIERGSHGPEHAPAVDIHVGGRHWWEIGDVEGDNSYPAVLAFVESYTRVALNAMLGELGEEMWVCCDTDGCVIDLTRARSWLAERHVRWGRVRSPFRVAEAVCEALSPSTWPLVPRVKMLSETLTVVGPQHYAGDSFERMAGRPGKPEVDARGELKWWAWPSVKWQMERGASAGFVRVERSWTSPSQLAHRWVLSDGTALPVSAWDPEFGPAEIMAWDDWSDVPEGLRLAPDQAPALAGLY